MQKIIELELSYLAAVIPEGLEGCEKAEIEDIYFPASEPHAKARIRKKGDKHEFTKKVQIDENDAGQQEEFNTTLTAGEYDALAKGDGRKVSKTRYFLPYGKHIAEVDIFHGSLAGLVIIEFEFNSLEEREAFEMPAFCLVDVTQEDFIAGGVLAGRSYKDIESDLNRFNYRTLSY